MVSELGQFLWASVFNVVTLMSGVVAFGLELLRLLKGYEVTVRWYVTLIVLCLLVGSFQAWRVEHEKVEAAAREQPDLHLGINYVGFGDNEDLSPSPAEKGAFAFVVAGVTNTGKASGAFGYQLVVYAGGNTYRAEPRAVHGPRVRMPQPDGSLLSFPDSDALYEKTFNPIQTGGAVNGVLFFAFGGISYTVLSLPDARFVLSCRDVNEKVYTVEVGPKDYRQKPLDFVPGLHMQVERPPSR